MTRAGPFGEDSAIVRVFVTHDGVEFAHQVDAAAQGIIEAATWLPMPVD